MDPTQSELEKQRLEGASAAQIERDIRGTRREMDETLDELGERLHPRHLLEDVIGLFRGDRGTETRSKVARSTQQIGRSIAREIKERPLPALLVGAGLAWWVIDAVSGDEDDGHRYPNYSATRSEPRRSTAGYSATSDYPLSGGTVGESASSGSSGSADDGKGVLASAKEKVAHAASAMGEKLSGVASAAGEKLSQAGEAMSSATEAGMESVRAGRRSVGRYATRSGRAIREGAQGAQERFREATEEHPLAVGGAMLAAGLLAGLLLPRSRREDEWLGEASDQLKEETRAKGEELLERGKAVATETAASALDEAEARGVTPGNLADKAARVVSEAVRAGSQAAKEEGISPADLAEDAKSVARSATQAAKSSTAKEAQDFKPRVT